MKKIVFLLFLALPVLVQAQNDDPYLTRSLSADNIRSVEAQTAGGSISVTAVAAAEARIEVYIKGNSNDNLSKDEIRKRLEEKYDLEISVSNNKLSAIAKQKFNFKDWKNALSISYRVYVPKNVNTRLATSGGSIQLTGLTGSQDFKTSGGSLSMDGLSGNIVGKTSGGSISVKNSSDKIDLKTSGGSITAKNCNGKISLHTSGGSLDLGDLKGDINAMTSGGYIKGSTIEGDLIAHTSGGSVRLDNLSGSIDASTSGGHIDVEVAALGKYVKLHNSGGNIDLSLPRGKGLDLDLAANRVKVDQITNFTGKAEDDRIDGKMNGGGVPINVKSGSGRINVEFK